MAARKKSAVSVSQEAEAEDLRQYADEAEKVDLMTRTPGWEIIKRDLLEYRDNIGKKLPYTSTISQDYVSSRILYNSCDKLLSLIEDYAQNRLKAVELLRRLHNQKENIILDVDNED